jgi:transcriptional regulator with XRE-family HTH domain
MFAVTSFPSMPCQKLGRQLRAMREAAGLTVVEAAERLELSRSALGRMVLGQAQVSVPMARAMMELYDQFRPELLGLVRDTRLPAWWTYSDVANKDYLSREDGAATAHEVAVARVPELLQVKAYAEALLLTETEDMLDTRRVRSYVRDGVFSRTVRRSRFAEHPMLRLFAVVTEDALRQRVGSLQVMLTQWAFLVRAGSWAAVTLHVLPAAARVQARPSDAFSVLQFRDADDLPLLYANGPEGMRRVGKSGSVERTLERYYRLCGACLSHDQSVKFIQQLIQKATEPIIGQ